MKRVLTAIFILFILVGCSTSKKMSNVMQQYEEIPTTIDMSNMFRMFWNDYVTELQSKKSLKGYVPSEQLVSTYNISNELNQYCVNGFIVVDSLFDDTQNLGYEARLQRLSSDHYSFSVPLSEMVHFIKLSGIRHIELSERVYIRK